MPGDLPENFQRASYVESTETLAALRLIAMRDGVSVSTIIRDATKKLLDAEDPTGVFTRRVEAALGPPKERDPKARRRKGPK